MKDVPTKIGFSRATDGAAMVEFAFMLPLLLVFIFGVEEYGRLFLAQSTLDRATYVAARCGAVNQTSCPDAGSIRTFANGQLWGIINSGSVTFTPTVPSCPTTPGLSTANVVVTASYPFSFIVNIPALVNAGSSTSMTLSASATYPMQC
jgi:Flp pilus assembly protein TadG